MTLPRTAGNTTRSEGHLSEDVRTCGASARIITVSNAPPIAYV